MRTCSSTFFPAEKLEALIRASVGLRVRATDLVTLQSWVAARMQTQGLTSPDAYESLLQQKSPAGQHEREQLTVRLTTGETYFWRDPGQLGLLSERLLPELMQRRAAERCLRVWSAGCASGEEAYTLAMLLHELLLLHPGWKVELIATDINTQALALARRARYRQWSFRALDPWRQQRYFRAEGQDWVLAPALRERVRFAHADLVTDPIPDAGSGLQAMDLIVCRNVFIYMDPLAVAQVAGKLAAALAEGGYLVTGHGELLGHHVHGLHTRVFAESVVLHKATSTADAAPDRTWPKPVEPARSTVGQLPAARVRAGVAPRRAPVSDGAAEFAALLQNAWRWADQGQSGRALQVCQDALKLKPFEPWPYYLQAQLAQERGDVSQAIALFDKVIYLDPALVAAYLALAGLLSQQGKPGRARTMLQTACLELRKLSPATPVKPYEHTTAGDLLAYIESQLTATAEPSPDAAPAMSVGIP